MKKSHITLLGTGLMGAPMTLNLLAAGFNVTVWNRSLEKAMPLKDKGAKIAQTAVEAVQNADFVITMLSDGSIVNKILFEAEGVAKSMKKGATLIDMSSIKPAQAKNQAQQLASLGIHHLDAPVSGGTKGAENASLAIMVGGDEDIFQTAIPVFEAMGRPVRVGPSGSGQLSKLANQAIVAVTIGVVAEAMLLAEKGGAEPAAIRQALKGGFADSIILQQHGARMTTNNFTPGGLSHLQLKDLNNALEEAEACGLTLPLAEQVRSRFKRLCDDLDGSEKDHSALYLELMNLNGL